MQPVKMSQAPAGNSEISENIPKIKSFAFFDIETTGLPSQENNRTKITEISLVACSVEHLLNTKKHELPRILHKLTLCCNPFKRISDKSEEITGLTNDLLENEKKFDELTASTLHTFLSHLQQPCALVAHNGIKFDFPILKRMLEMNDATLMENLLVADSLKVFREIDELETELSFCALTPDASDKEEQKLDDYIVQELLSMKKVSTGSDEKPQSLQEINETTPEKQTISVNDSMLNVHRKEKKPSEEEVTPTTSNKCERFNENNKRLRDVVPKSRRDLFGAKKSFKLTDIYQRIYEREPEHSHYAEGDVITLLKCAIANNEDFVRVVQDHAKYFRDIPALGKK